MEFSYYKDKNQLEVDIVMESGNLVAEVEVKAGATVMPSDFRGLRRLKEASGERPASGVVPYQGEATVGFGDRLHAVSLRMLWEGS